MMKHVLVIDLGPRRRVLGPCSLEDARGMQRICEMNHWTSMISEIEDPRDPSLEGTDPVCGLPVTPEKMIANLTTQVRELRSELRVLGGPMKSDAVKLADDVAARLPILDRVPRAETTPPRVVTRKKC